jgi:hypothetical protein
MMMTYDRQEFDKTLAKEQNVKLKEALVLKRIKEIEGEFWFQNRKQLSDRKHKIDSVIAERKKYFTENAHREFIDRAPLLKMSKRAAELQVEINAYSDQMRFYNYLNKLVEDLSRDNRLEHFIDVVKGHLSKEDFNQVWTEANRRYEERLTELAGKSTYEVMRL